MYIQEAVLIFTHDSDQFFPGGLGLVQRALPVEPLHEPQASWGLPASYTLVHGLSGIIQNFGGALCSLNFSK